MADLINVVGADLTGISAPTEAGTYIPRFNVTQIGEGRDGNGYQYVKFNSTCTAYDAVGIDTSGNASALTKALLDAGNRVGTVPYAVSVSGTYGWVTISPFTSASVRAASAAASASAVYTTSNAGILGTSSGSQTKVSGLYFTVGNTTSAAAAITVTGQLGSLIL